nr:vegetative cell wall protein gp1-like [Lolium perenne]
MRIGQNVCDPFLLAEHQSSKAADAAEDDQLRRVSAGHAGGQLRPALGSCGQLRPCPWPTWRAPPVPVADAASIAPACPRPWPTRRAPPTPAPVTASIAPTCPRPWPTPRAPPVPVADAASHAHARARRGEHRPRLPPPVPVATRRPPPTHAPFAASAAPACPRPWPTRSAPPVLVLPAPALAPARGRRGRPCPCSRCPVRHRRRGSKLGTGGGAPQRGGAAHHRFGRGDLWQGRKKRTMLSDGILHASSTAAVGR